LRPGVRFAREGHPAPSGQRKGTIMAPKFGTSGLRGLVSELTDALVGDYTRAFLGSVGIKERLVP
tara:strand:+ start:197 stop:391 length:195 start_codon:yes stop_codon:yes gene_type:complete